MKAKMIMSIGVMRTRPRLVANVPPSLFPVILDTFAGDLLIIAYMLPVHLLNAAKTGVEIIISKKDNAILLEYLNPSQKKEWNAFITAQIIQLVEKSMY